MRAFFIISKHFIQSSLIQCHVSRTIHGIWPRHAVQIHGRHRERLYLHHQSFEKTQDAFYLTPHKTLCWYIRRAWRGGGGMWVCADWVFSYIRTLTLMTEMESVFEKLVHLINLTQLTAQEGSVEFSLSVLNQQLPPWSTVLPEKFNRSSVSQEILRV